MFEIDDIPVLPISKKPVAEQVAMAALVANRLGLHDASDAIRQMIPNIANLRYGCHVEVGVGESVVPDCVLDEGDYTGCFYAKKGMRREQCEYWRIVTTDTTAV